MKPGLKEGTFSPGLVLPVGKPGLKGFPNREQKPLLHLLLLLLVYYYYLLLLLLLLAATLTLLLLLSVWPMMQFEIFARAKPGTE